MKMTGGKLLICLALVVEVVMATGKTGDDRWTAMLVNCKDVGKRCAYLTKLGYCRLAPSPMSKICMKSCGLCGKKKSYNGWNIHMKYQEQNGNQ